MVDVIQIPAPLAAQLVPGVSLKLLRKLTTKKVGRFTICIQDDESETLVDPGYEYLPERNICCNLLHVYCAEFVFWENVCVFLFSQFVKSF